MENKLSKDSLLWQCRRGMLELDFLFERFVREKYDSLNHEQQLNFQRLLNEQDPVLYSWLMGYELPTDPNFIILIEMIRGVKLA